MIEVSLDGLTPELFRVLKSQKWSRALLQEHEELPKLSVIPQCHLSVATKLLRWLWTLL